MVNRSKRLEACISSADLCSNLARTTTRLHIDITNVYKDKSYKPPPILKKLTKKQIKFALCYEDLLTYLLSEKVSHPFNCLTHDII
jgi:hypothetical protein